MCCDHCVIWCDELHHWRKRCEHCKRQCDVSHPGSDAAVTAGAAVKWSSIGVGATNTAGAVEKNSATGAGAAVLAGAGARYSTTSGGCAVTAGTGDVLLHQRRSCDHGRSWCDVLHHWRHRGTEAAPASAAGAQSSPPRARTLLVLELSEHSPTTSASVCCQTTKAPAARQNGIRIYRSAVTLENITPATRCEFRGLPRRRRLNFTYLTITM